MIKAPKVKTCICQDCKRTIPVEFIEDGFCPKCIADMMFFCDDSAMDPNYKI